jgi:FkbM family methyltransferase
MSCDEITNDLFPPTEQTPDLMSIRAPQPLQDAVKGLRQWNGVVVHEIKVPASSVSVVSERRGERIQRRFQTSLLKLARTDAGRLLRAVLRFLTGRGLLIQLLPNVPALPLIRLGSTYGGWVILDDPGIRSGFVVSGGAGEDVSFDIELLARYSPRVLIVDPTPRAIDHVNTVLARVGEPARVPYADGGSQPAEAYDLRDVDAKQIVLIEAAVAEKVGVIELFEPEVSNHVSYSAIRPKRSQVQSIRVPALTIASIIQNESGPFEILKLDIEGIAGRVLDVMLVAGHRPTQILVEFDELLRPSRPDLRAVKEVDRQLRVSGYRRVHTDRWSNFTYVLRGRW